jgi:SAM-dependent methyltransferase
MTFSTFLKRTKNRLNYLSSMNYKIQLSKFIYYYFSRIYEIFHSVDFYKIHTLAELGHPLDGELIHYGATRTYEINSVLRSVCASKNDSILDFGCGKGLGLVNFYRYGFKKVCGIELNTQLCKIAQKNLKTLKIENLSVINGDATLLKEHLDDFNYFYFYNPFTGSVFSKVISNIVDSHARKPRQITIIYNYPVEREVILKTNLFVVIHRYVPFFFGGEFLVFRSPS